MVWNLGDVKSSGDVVRDVLVRCYGDLFQTILIKSFFQAPFSIEVNSSALATCDEVSLETYLLNLPKTMATGEEIIRKIQDLTHGKIIGKFFEIKENLRDEEFVKILKRVIGEGKARKFKNLN